MTKKSWKRYFFSKPYLGLVPVTKASGNKCYQGHIIRASRNLTRTLFTQAIPYIGQSSPTISKWYQDVRLRRGVGRSRIALIRKTVKIMRRIILERKKYYWMEDKNYKWKIEAYYRILNKESDNVKMIA